MEMLWDGAVDLKFVPCPIVSNFVSYSNNFPLFNTIFICYQYSKYYTQRLNAVA